MDEPNKTIEFVEHNGEVVAIIIHREHQGEGVNFITPHHFPKQLAYMSHQKGHIITPHYHAPVKREIEETQEVLVIKKGKIKADLYNSEQTHIATRILEEGDTILLASGGHGLEIIEDVEMIEIKQGPYLEKNDKRHF